jgi:PAS domain S-box-containing protein
LRVFFLALLAWPFHAGAETAPSAKKIELTPEEKFWIAEHPDIRLGVDQGWSPYVKRRDDGVVEGIEPAILARIKALTGANIRLELGHWADIVAQAERGELHGLAVSAAQKEREARFLFSDSHYSGYKYIYLRRDQPSPPRNMADLAGKKVGFLQANLAEEKLIRPIPGIASMPYGSALELATALVKGEVDAALSGVSLLMLARGAMLPLEFAFPVPNSEVKLRYSIRKEYPELLSILNKALAALGSEEIRAIHARWGALFSPAMPGLALSAEEHAWLQAHPKIVLGISDQFQPDVIVQPDGSRAGLVVDYFNLLNQQLGNRLELHVERDWDTVTAKAMRRELDGLASSTPNPTWDRYFIYSEPYYHGYFHIYTRADSPPLHGLAGMKGKRVGYLAGMRKAEYLLQSGEWITAVALKDSQDMVTALLESRVDAVVGGIDLEWWRKQNSLISIKITGFIQESRHPLLMSLRNDWPLLPGIINKALRAISAAERERISQRWLGGDAQPAVPELSPEERAWVAAHPVVRARIGDFPPYHFWDDSPRGISVELLERIARDTGFRLEYLHDMAWPEALKRIENHDGLDLLPIAKRTPEREAVMAFSQDYLQLPWMIFTRDKDKSIFGLEDLFGKTIAIEDGYALQDQLAEQYPQIRQHQVKDAETALLALSEGRVDAYIGNLAVAQHHIAQRGLGNLKVAAGTPLGLHTQAFAVRKDWPQLASILDKGLATIPPAERSEIERKYLSLAVTSEIDYEHLWQVAGVALLAVTLVLLWNRALKREIVRRKQAEAELARERVFLKTLISTIPDLIWLKDPQGVYLACNSRFEQLFGASEADIVGKTDYDFVPKETADFFRRYDRLALENGKISINEEDAVFASDGHYEWLETTKTPMRDASGKLIGVMGIGHDITERKWAEQALRDSQSKYQRLVDDIGPNFVIFSYRADGVIEYLSNGFAPVFGIPAQAAMSRPWQEVIPWEADSLALALETHARLVSGEQDETELELRFRHPDHSLRLVELMGHAVRGVDGKFTHVEGIARDITEIKRAVAELREAVKQREAAEQFARETIDALSAHLCVLDEKGNIMMVNRAWREFGAKNHSNIPRDGIGACYLDIADAAQDSGDALGGEFARQLRRVFSGEIQAFQFEYPCHSSAEKHWFIADVTRFSSQPLRAVIAHENITARKQAEEALIEARQAADAANQAKSAFLANMSHELRTPLNAIMGFAQILAHDDTLGPAQLHQVQDIQRGGEYLLTLISDVLDLAKIEAGRLEILAEPFNLVDTLNDIQGMFQIHAFRRKLEFRYQVEGELPRQAKGDSKRLRQILINLLGNAMKFTEQGAVTLRASFGKGCLRLEIEDTGIGIAPEDQEKIFQPFSQSGENRYKLQGTGLGLTITRKLIERMGGEIGLRSELGKGSVFSVGLPLQVLDGEAPAAPAETRRVIGYRRLAEPELVEGNGAFNVLITDDIASNRLILRGMLQPLGFEAMEASSGEECLELAASWQPEVILLDLRMAGMDGHETTRELRKQARFANTLIIMISASNFAEDQAASLQAGCAAHIGKPVKKDELLAVLQARLPLQWLYREPETAAPAASGPPFSQEQAAELLNILRHGDITRVIQTLQGWARQPDCPSNVPELLALAHDFEIEKLRRTLENC